MPIAGKRLLVVGEHDDLARVVAAAATERGAHVTASASGRDALARVAGGQVDAVLVDLPLPDVRGDVFLVALRDRGLPCVAVSGVLKGQRYALLAQQFGAIAFYEKPFSVEDALAMLGAAMLDGASGETLPEWPDGAAPRPAPLPEEPPAHAAEPSATANEDATPTAAATAIATPAAASASPASATAPEADPGDPDSLIYSPARPALDETLPGVPLTPRPAHGLELPLPATTPVPIGRSAIAPPLPVGDLGATSVPRLLAALHATRVTGALTVTRGEVKKLVLVEAGRPVLATSNVAAERFGARAVRAGVLGAQALAALAEELGPSASVGDALVARGHLDPAARARMVRDQICEVVWSTFAWRDGSYRLLVGPLPRRARVTVDLPPADLILEGVRRTATLDRLREELPARLALARRPGGGVSPDELTLSPGEAAMLAHADGTKTVGDLVVLSHLPERDALAFLQGCRDLGLLDEVSRVLAGTRRIGFM